MYNDEDLKSAVNAGIFTDESVVEFRTLIASQKQTVGVDEEHFRLVSSFNDIFVSIACVLLLFSIAQIGSDLSNIFGAISLAIVSWGLAEFFVQKRRMALPAILLLVAFVGGIVWATVSVLSEIKSGPSISIFSSGCLGVIAARIHWERFKVPITVAVGAGTFSGCIILLIETHFQQLENWVSAILFLCGIFSFSMAMYWDMLDTNRQTRKSDVAFWLHLLAAPLLVHPVFSSLGILEGQSGPMQTISVMGLYVLMAFISIAIDRRALMVSSLIYVLYAFSSLLKAYGLVSLGFAITGTFIGSVLLLLSAFWHLSRAWLLGHLSDFVQSRLPPLR